jgi:hypothetical protein
MAHNFTFNDPNFGVYFKDISPDNIVIDQNMKLRLVDLEHVIIVDKTTPPEGKFYEATEVKLPLDELMQY